jgi:hypothetical protein
VEISSLLQVSLRKAQTYILVLRFLWSNYLEQKINDKVLKNSFCPTWGQGVGGLQESQGLHVVVAGDGEKGRVQETFRLLTNRTDPD